MIEATTPHIDVRLRHRHLGETINEAVHSRSIAPDREVLARVSFPHVCIVSWTTENRPRYDKRRYGSDLTDEEWALIELLMPPAKPGGRRRMVEVREAVKGRYADEILQVGTSPLARHVCEWAGADRG